MVNIHHPDPEELLLWQSGELDESRFALITDHLENCTSCRDKIEGYGAMLNRIAEVKSEAASTQFRLSLDAKEKLPATGRLSRLRSIAWSSIAACVTIALVITTFTGVTVEARAEALLSQAIDQERQRPGHQHLLISNGGRQCSLSSGQRQLLPVIGSVPESAVQSDQDFCQRTALRFEEAGWDSMKLLSVSSFSNWRNSLNNRADKVRELGRLVAITSSGDSNNLLRLVTFSMDSETFSVSSAHFEFAAIDANAGHPARESFDVEATSELAVVIPGQQDRAEVAIDYLPAEVSDRHAPEQLHPLDEVEISVRKVLHEQKLDRNVLVDVRRRKTAIEVWGIVSDEQTRRTLTEELQKLDLISIKISAQPNGHEEIPWTMYRGKGMPLAWEQLDGMFKNNSSGRQEFINRLDKTTLSFAATMRSLQNSQALLKRVNHFEQAAGLRPVIDDLRRSAQTDLETIFSQLRPIVGETDLSVRRISTQDANRLYTLIHELIFMGPQDECSLEEVIKDIRKCLR